MSNRGENASLRWLVSVIEGTGDQADESHSHDSRRDTEANIHSGVSLDPNEKREGDEFSDGEGEISSIEVGGEFLGLFRVICWVELVCSMSNHVWFNTPTP